MCPDQTTSEILQDKSVVRLSWHHLPPEASWEFSPLFCRFSPTLILFTSSISFQFGIKEKGRGELVGGEQR